MSLKKIGITVTAGALLIASLAAAESDMGMSASMKHGHSDDTHGMGTTLEVHINDNGKVLVRGAKVTGVSGNTILASTAWGGAAINWTVTTDGSTEFVRRFGGASSMSEVS